MGKYTRHDNESKVFAVVALFVLLCLLALVILQVCGVFDEPLWRPVAEYPMANAHISWQQTFRAGAFR